MHTNRTHEQGIQRKGSEAVIGHNLRGARGWGGDIKGLNSCTHGALV